MKLMTSMKIQVTFRTWEGCWYPRWPRRRTWQLRWWSNAGGLTKNVEQRCRVWVTWDRSCTRWVVDHRLGREVRARLVAREGANNVRHQRTLARAGCWWSGIWKPYARNAKARWLLWGTSISRTVRARHGLHAANPRGNARTMLRDITRAKKNRYHVDDKSGLNFRGDVLGHWRASVSDFFLNPQIWEWILSTEWLWLIG